MKVLLFQVFDRQKVVQIDEEPIHICGSGQSSDLFLVCLKSGKINVYSAANDVPLVYTFPTHSRIVFALEHSQEHGIVATIEPEAAQSAINVVRVYKLPLTQALRPYFTQTNESEDGPDDSEDVRTYQLPLHASAKAVAVCPKTGKIAVATETDISVWAPAGTNRYEKVYQIEMAAVRIVAIHGPYLAYCTDRTVSVFECLVVRNKSVNSNNGSSSSDSNNFTGKATKSVPKVRLHSGPFPVRDNEQTVVMKSHGSSSISANVAIPCVNFFTEARTTGAQKEKRKRVKFGPISDMETLMKVEAQYAVKTFQLLVYEKFSTELGPIHTLFFLPEYSHIVSDSDLTLSTDEGCTKKDGSAHEANRRAKEEEEVVVAEESEAKEEEIGMRCFVSTKIEGKLYNVCEPCELATYAYTNPTLQCCANDKFIYAVTDAEVDAFTLRTSLSAAEYDPVPPCLMGMKNFLGVCRVLSPGNFVVLLSKVKASETAALLERFRSPTKRTPMRPKRRLPRLGIVERENSDSEACGGGSGDGCGGDDNNNNDNDDGCASSICGSGDVDWNDGEEINWIMYSMHPYSLHMLYDDIIERVLTTQSLSTEGSATVEGADSQGYYQLVLEGHFLLQAKIVSLKRRLRQCRAQHQQPQQKDKIVLDIKAYSSLLRHSSGVLGDYFFRATKEYHKAAQCYSDSDRKLSSTVTMFLGAAAAREALVEYLDRVLFDTRMQAYADETTQLSDAILAYYAEYAPHRLSTVVVDSFLRRYTKTTALALLCLAPGLMPHTPKERRAKITELEKRGYSLTSLSSGALFLVPKDAMACVLTQLSLGMRDQAVSMLRRTDPSSIVDFCASYPQFLRAETPEKAQTHPLVCVLRDAAPLALLEIAVRLGNEAVHLSVFDAVADASMRKVLRVFYLEYRLMPHEKECVCESVVHLSDGPHLCHKVTTNSLANSTNEHADELASLYLDMALEGGSDQHQNYDKLRPRNTSNNNNDNSSDCFDKWLEQHHKVFIESSPQWLKDLFDFACCDDATATAYLTDDDDSAAEGSSSSSSLAFSKFSVGNSTSSSKSSGYKLNIFYARKLVGLLCSGLLRDPTNLVERLREAAVAASAGATVAGARARKVLDVILALAAPLVLQQKKTFSELVAIAPGAALDFGMSFCDAPEDWKNILEALLPFCCGNGRSSDKGVCTVVVVGVYEDILEYTALLYEPAVFLRLLPSEGNLEFFERYIELSFRKSDSVVVRTEFMNLLRHTESENSHL